MAGARRRLRYPVRVSGPNGPVTVRFMTPSRPGWSLKEAVDLVRQGYTVEHASRASGWAPGLIEAQVGNLPHTTIDRTPRLLEATVGAVDRSPIGRSYRELIDSFLFMMQHC